MKVALFISSEQVPELGGGYTFENHLFNAISQLGSESKHDFIYYNSRGVVFTDLPASTPKPTASDFFGCDKIKAQLLYVFKVILFSMGLRVILSAIRRWWQERYLLKSLKKNQIDVTLSLVPFYCPPLEYPCIIPVWDLQHRLQPYFPEVSLSRQWKSRENYYARVLRRVT